jgi:hypothetical protein
MMQITRESFASLSDVRRHVFLGPYQRTSLSGLRFFEPVDQYQSLLEGQRCSLLSQHPRFHAYVFLWSRDTNPQSESQSKRERRQRYSLVEAY